MSTVLILPPGPHRSAHCIALPIRVLAAHRARCFGIMVTPDDGTTKRQYAHAYRSSVATTVENLAMADDLPSDPSAWFAAFIARVRRTLDAPSRRAMPLSACLGISVAARDGRTVTCTATGAMAVRRIARSSRGAITVSTLVVPTAPTSPPAFTNALEGLLGVNDALAIGVPELCAALPDAFLIRAWRRGSIPAAVADVTARIAACDAPAPLLLVLGSSARASEQSHASMASFLRTATTTDGFLTPKLLPTLGRILTDARRAGAAVRAVRPRTRRQSGHSAARFLTALTASIRLVFTTIAVAARSAVAVAMDTARLAVTAVRSVVRHARALIRFVALAHARAQRATPTAATPPTAPASSLLARARREGLRVFRHGTAAHIAGATMHTARQRYAALPTTSRRLLILASVFGLLFLGSTVALWRAKVRESDVASYNARIATIEELRSVAEAQLLFGDRREALQTFRSAATLVADLPRDSRARRERATMLTEETTASLDRARLLTHIERPLTLAGASAAIPTIGAIALVGNDVIVVADDRSAFARVHLPAGTADVTRIVPAPQLAPGFRAMAFDDRLLLLVDGHAAAAFVDVTNGQMTTAAIESPPPEVRDAAVFQKRLYLLHADGAISRRARTAGGFDRGAVWLRANPETAELERLFVNGAAFASDTRGGVARFLAGRRSDTDLIAAVDPPLAAPALLTALRDPDADVLYLGVPEDGRVIAVRDDGALIGQLQSDAFRGMRDLDVAPDGASLFVLTGSTVSVVVPPD